MNPSDQPTPRTGPPRTGPLRHGNHRGDPNTAPRCGAKTRAGTPCQSPAMKNGRCRMHGGKCRGPTTEEGKARISAALDKGRMRGKRWQGFNDATSRMKRQGRVYRAMLDAHMLPPDIAPIVRDVRAFLGLLDPGYDEASLESATHYACMGLMALGHDRIAVRCLASRIREAGRLRPTKARGVKIPKNARHREDAPVDDAVNVRDMPCTVSQPFERPVSADSAGNTGPVSEARFRRTIFGRHAALLAANPAPAIEPHRPAGGCWYRRVTTAQTGGPGRRVPLGAIRGPG